MLELIYKKQNNMTYQFDFPMMPRWYQRHAEKKLDIPLFDCILIIEFKPIVKVLVDLIIRFSCYNGVVCMLLEL